MKVLWVLLLCTGSIFGQQYCGIERNAVKTLSDIEASQISDHGPAVISELVQRTAPNKKALLRATKRFPAELSSVAVFGRLIGYKLETDGDIHIVVRDLLSKDTMIVEIPNPDCMPAKSQAKTALMREAFQKEFGKATSRFKRIKSTTVIQVTGPLFYDFLHRQTGVAQNGIEIHPVTDLKAIL